MPEIDLIALETELKKRIAEPFAPWGRKQSDAWDTATRFVYHTPTWDALKTQARTGCPPDTDPREFFNYAANRWFNFWSAKGIEHIFAQLPAVQPNKNHRDRLVDFTLYGIPFDHKTSVFPRKYPASLQFAWQHPASLIHWLYQNQSQEGRRHFGNRLFIILFDSHGGEHWKLRAELRWLQSKIGWYARRFDPDALTALCFEPEHITLADIIWAVK